MTYNEYINNIIQERGKNGIADGEYKETHHIIPKCLGGTNEKENLIDLYAKEHYEAHRLLALENPENNKLGFAWWMMAHCDKEGNREVTAEQYEEARKAFSKLASKYNKGRSVKHSVEWNKKISEAHKNKKRSKETVRKYSEAQRQKVRCVETGVEYYSASEAERQTKANHSSIMKACKDKKKTSGGFHWEVVE